MCLYHEPSTGTDKWSKSGKMRLSESVFSFPARVGMVWGVGWMDLYSCYMPKQSPHSKNILNVKSNNYPSSAHLQLSRKEALKTETNHTPPIDNGSAVGAGSGYKVGRGGSGLNKT